MDNPKPKSLKGIEDRMQDLDQNSLRYRILQSAKNFKVSWIELGQALYSVWKERLYKEWGYATIEAYTSREIGIRKQTAMKLLRSYYFLEKEEPAYLKQEDNRTSDVSKLPSYESIDILRRAKNKKALDEEDYDSLKKGIFEQGKDASDLRKDLSAMIRQREELKPEEALKKRSLSTVRRLVGTLKSIKQEAEIAKLLPAAIIRETASLIKKLEQEIS